MTFPVFAAGDVLAASDMNAVGLWRITSGITATNGTVSDGVVTVGNAVGSVTVSGAFSSTYRNYKIVMTGGTASVGGTVAMTLGGGGNGYYSSIVYTFYATNATGGAGVNNGTNFTYAGVVRPTWSHMNLDICNPQQTERTTINGGFVNFDASGSVGGFLDNATAYTAFTLTPSAGTMTGQRITIYGYRN